MPFNEFMNKVRHLDNSLAKKIERLLYIPFLCFLVGIIVATFVNSLKIIDISTSTPKSSLIEQILLTQTFNTLLIVILLIFNSFIVLYIFNNILRIRNVLKNIDFNLSHRRNDQRHKEN